MITPKEKFIIKKEGLIKKEDCRSLKDQLQAYAVRCEAVGRKSCRYLNLRLFKNQVEGCKAKQILKMHSKRLFFYRAIFYTFALLFIGMSYFAFSNTLSITTTLFGNFLVLPKFIVCSLSLLFGGIALAIGSSLCLIKEMTTQLMQRAKRQLLEIYGYLGEEFKRAPNAKNEDPKRLYRSLMYAIDEKTEHATFVLKEIQRAKNLSPQEKQELLCQALEEMEKEFNAILEDAKYRLFLAP